MNSNTSNKIDHKLLKQASKFIILEKYNDELKELGGITPSYINGLNEVYSAVLESFSEIRLNHQILALILYELSCEFNSQQRTANQISKIAPSLVKGVSALPEVIEAFKKHPANISGITFHVRNKGIQYDVNTEEKIIWNLKAKKAYKDKAIKIEGFEFISEISKFILEKENQFKLMAERDKETQKPKYKGITSLKADSKFRKKTAPIILNFLKISIPGKTRNYYFTLGSKLHALINLMPSHSLEKHKTKKSQTNYYRSMFMKDLQ